MLTLDHSLDYGDLLQTLSVLAALAIGCWKASRWQATMEYEVHSGFARNDQRHSEMRDVLQEQRQVLVEHGEHLASLDERTALLLRNV